MRHHKTTTELQAIKLIPPAPTTARLGEESGGCTISGRVALEEIGVDAHSRSGVQGLSEQACR